MSKRTFLTTILIVSICQLCFSQKYYDQVFNNKIKTVRCYKKGWPLSYPSIELNSDTEIEITFDDLENVTKNYYYTIVHCDKNWEESMIPESKYISGINQNSIYDYDYSFNTTTNYIHYTINIPNDDVQLKCSGNYIIKVYEDFNSDTPVFTKRFIVYESQVTVDANVRYILQSSVQNEVQRVDFTINHPKFEILNPLDEITVHIFQNKRLDNAILDIKPQFIKNNQLVYHYINNYSFEAGNEFRSADIRGLNNNGGRIQEMSYHEPYYHAVLFPDKPLINSKYYFNNDFNGDYVIESYDNEDVDLESEYIIVHFTLQRTSPFAGAKVYLLGSFTDWLFNKDNELHYNYNTGKYEKSMLLKQGYYNYQYAVITNGSDKASVYPVENSFAETENNYRIIVYYRGTSDQYDRIIGMTMVNSGNK